MTFKASLILCLILPSLACAAEAGPNLQIPPGGTLRGHFAETHFFPNGKTPLQSDGHFLVAPAHGIIWSIEKPLPITAIINSTGLTEKLGNFNLPSISASREPVLAQATELLGDAFTGKWQKLEKDFIVTRKATVKGWEVTLTPRDLTNMSLKSIIADGDKFVRTAQATRADGGLDNFVFSDQAVSTTPPTAAELTAFTTANADK